MLGAPRIEVIGHDALMSKLAQVRVQGRFILASSLKELVERIYEESQMLVPVDTGALKESGRVEQTGMTRFGSSGEWAVIYGSDEVVNPKTGRPTSEYALVVHETHPEQMKFIEEPAERLFSELAEIAGARFRVLGAGGVVGTGTAII